MNVMPRDRSVSSLRPTWRPIRMALTGGAVALSIILAAAMLSEHTRRRDLADSSAALSNTALMLSAHLESSFAVLEAVQEGIIDDLHQATTEDGFIGLASTLALHQTITMRVGAIRYAGGVTLMDNRGILINSTYYWPMPYRDLSDRQYFRVLSAENAPTRFVSEPVQNRANGLWTIYVARRISAPDGAFLGILLGEINFPYFQQFFAEVAPQSDAVVSIFHLNGTLLVRQPSASGVIGTAPDTGAYRLLSQGLDHGTQRGISPIDNVDRLIAVHRMPKYPLMVSFSRSVTAVLQPWREQQRYIILGSFTLEVALAVIATLYVRYIYGQKQVEEMKASLVKAEIDRAVATEHERFRVAVNAMTQGLCMFDRTHRVIVSNPRFAAIFALSPETLAEGAPAGRTVGAAVRAGTVAREDIRRLRALLDAAPGNGSNAWDLADGRSLLVDVHRMSDGGWLMTVTDITERRRAEARIAYIAQHDQLTGLANRTQFHERLEAATGLATRGAPHALLCLDLDHFKAVNDTLGHSAGDALLREVTARLRRCCRETDVIARLGGDEFAIVQPLISPVIKSPLAASVLAQRIIDELSLPFDLQGHQVIIGCSIGIALMSSPDQVDPEALLKCADLALYRAKADGRSCFRFFEPAMDAELHRRRALETDLRRAFANDEFQLVYQPLVDTRSGRVTAFEALMRWQQPNRSSNTGPADFIPVAEEIGLIAPLGKWAIETACWEAMRWPKEVAVAVNLSPVQFRGHNLVDIVREALNTSGLAPHRLELEITEGCLLNDTQETVATLRELRGLGVSVCMDDFGTGYSSLSYLVRFPFDKVKLDRSFIADLGNGGQHDVVVRAITTMCQTLGMRTTGEGVETEQQYHFLREHHCSEVQGYLLSKPIPGTEVITLLAALEELPATLFNAEEATAAYAGAFG